MQPLLSDNSLKSLAETIGPLPEGDIPAAWFCSTHPEVLAKYEEWRVAHQDWRDRFAELGQLSGFDPSTIRIATYGDDTLVGIFADWDTHTWWRKTKQGYWVPRKRTKAEKNSEVTQRFNATRRIPSVVRYLPGLPHSLWTQTVTSPDGDYEVTVYPVQVRKAKGPNTAVLVFLGADPDSATTPFEISEHWSRMKLSTFHMLRERQNAEREVNRFNPTRVDNGVRR